MATGEILDFTDSATVTWTKGAQSGTDPVYGLPIFPLTAAANNGKKELSSAIAGAPAASQNVLIYTATVATTFPGNFASTPAAVGSVGANPTATATYTVKKNGSAVGTISISTAGAFTFATTSGAAIALAAGDRLAVTAPATVDLTLVDVSFTLVGTF